ncbi:MAG: hypothetical protein M1380_04735 [Chloroflexi bacterium]|nr:hypothetical protein [Chloroflexota bacterium]
MARATRRTEACQGRCTREVSLMMVPAPSITDLGIDPDAAARLLPHLDSFMKWELLRFLHDNPDTPVTVEELARYLGRDETELKPAARALAGAGIFHQIDLGSEYAYALTFDEELRELIGHLVRRYLADPLIRKALSTQILGSHRRPTRLLYATR